MSMAAAPQETVVDNEMSSRLFAGHATLPYRILHFVSHFFYTKCSGEAIAHSQRIPLPLAVSQSETCQLAGEGPNGPGCWLALVKPRPRSRRPPPPPEACWRLHGPRPLSVPLSGPSSRILKDVPWKKCA
ncbi:hypothetical protein BBK36DRAFT_1164278 [Trichoderma citrinoviride]|uniref:Uncharacterized protein n=1 Tax=Trichoderma citrinoviride TaxID=58853 RepID=A0A2T4BLA0_9HYPO|nr:hypothetical protein BBK36DRAFT_1164278 [Trichoderma citrinoviride]PTB70086.1 hypothetical protein BBK36DRAFT_1164278 [Trichoderma citrinoviride]